MRYWERYERDWYEHISIHFVLTFAAAFRYSYASDFDSVIHCGGARCYVHTLRWEELGCVSQLDYLLDLSSLPWNKYDDSVGRVSLEAAAKW